LGRVIQKKETPDSQRLIRDVHDTFIAAFRGSTQDKRTQFLEYLEAQTEQKAFHSAFKQQLNELLGQVV
jgi:ATP-dependent protease HslVU (ClpYQ) peptidase subunit